MNGKAAKRIRRAARILAGYGARYRTTILRLKREYGREPYHVRTAKKSVWESHRANAVKSHRYDVHPAIMNKEVYGHTDEEGNYWRVPGIEGQPKP